MHIVKFPSGPLSTNAYLVGCPVTHEAVVIDPAMGSTGKILEEAKRLGLKIRKIFLTHSHWDHFVDAHLLQEKTGASLYVHALDKANVEHPGADLLPLHVPVAAAKVAGTFEDGDELKVGDEVFEVIHTPGHCPGAVCFYSPLAGVLFSGDTLFKGTMGTLNLPTASAEKMWISLKKLSQLPAHTKVFPGHGIETTIGREDWLSRAKEFFGG